jgi:hypothetical protein
VQHKVRGGRIAQKEAVASEQPTTRLTGHRTIFRIRSACSLLFTITITSWLVCVLKKSDGERERERTRMLRRPASGALRSTCFTPDLLLQEFRFDREKRTRNQVDLAANFLFLRFCQAARESLLQTCNRNCPGIRTKSKNQRYLMIGSCASTNLFE